MSKRGNITLLQLGTIIVGVLAAYLIVTAVIRFTSPEGTQKMFLARDAGLMIDTVIGLPQSCRILYENEKRYVALDKQKFSVFSKMPVQNQSADYSYAFIGRKEIFVTEGLQGNNFFVVKSDQQIAISNAPVLITNETQ